MPRSPDTSAEEAAMMLGLADDPQQAAAVLVDAELGPLLKEVG